MGAETQRLGEESAEDRVFAMRRDTQRRAKRSWRGGVLESSGFLSGSQRDVASGRETWGRLVSRSTGSQKNRDGTLRPDVTNRSPATARETTTR